MAPGKKNKGKLFILSGPSGVGKTTLFKAILKRRFYHNKLFRSVSMTTRSCRPGEKEGRDYFFISQKMFAYKIKAGHFLEWEQVFGNFYGTPKKLVRALQSQGKHVLLCIDVKGANTIRKKEKNSVSFFVNTPSIAELKRRLAKRGSETKQIQEKRLARAKEELKSMKYYDYVIINDQLELAVNELDKILKQEIEKDTR